MDTHFKLIHWMQSWGDFFSFALCGGGSEWGHGESECAEGGVCSLYGRWYYECAQAQTSESEISRSTYITITLSSISIRLSELYSDWLIKKTVAWFFSGRANIFIWNYGLVTWLITVLNPSWTPLVYNFHPVSVGFMDC